MFHSQKLTKFMHMCVLIESEWKTVRVSERKEMRMRADREQNIECATFKQTQSHVRLMC